MSLFKLKTIWNANFPQQEFDQRHLAYGIINKLPSVAIGSYKGVLRVYSLDQGSKNQNRLFKQIYQSSFDQPIIDVKFVSHPDQSIRGNTLGILLFKKFVYIRLQLKQDSGIYTANQMVVQVQPAFSIITSPLSLATINFSIQSLNPKELHPIKQSDSIYPFTISQENMFYMDGQDLVKIKGNIQQWRIIVGRVRSLFYVKQILIIIGELNLWEVDEGKIIKCKKLQEEVSCGTIAHKKNNQFNIIVCNFLMQMLVYTQDYSLVWAVKLDYVPIRLIISQYQQLKGAMIFLTDQGSIQIAYAGAQIQQRTLKPIQQEVNMERVQKQTQYFLQKIKDLKSNPYGKKTQISKTSDSSTNMTLKLTFSQPEQTSQFVDNSQQFYRSPKSNKLIKCVLTLQIVAQGTELTKLLITVIKPSNIYCKNQEIQLERLRGKQYVKFDCFISKQKFPYQTQLNINIRYEKGTSVKIISKSILIPISFQCQIQSYESMKNAEKNVTFKCTDNPLPSFNDIFGDIMERGVGQQKKAITFTLINGVKSSIVYNKNLTKVKIQSQVYSGLCFIFLQFMRRLQSYLEKTKQKIQPVEIDVSLKQMQQQISDYHSYRVQLKNEYKQIQQKTEQFKKTQKKLLLKMKQKNSSIQHINKLLEFTYGRILKAGQKYQQTLEEASIANHNFQVGLKFVMELIYKRSAATQRAKDTAQSIIKFDSQNQNILDDQSWAQRLSKNASFYLNKKYEPTVQNIQKLVTWVITKVNNGDWNN